MTATRSFLNNVSRFLGVLTGTQADLLEGVINTLRESSAAKLTNRVVLEFVQNHQVAMARKSCLTYMENYSQGWFAMVSIVEDALVIQIGLFDEQESTEDLYQAYQDAHKAPQPMRIIPIGPETEF